MQTYIVGRRNQSQPCDIELPADEKSVSRQHLELSPTSEGRYYIVHLHRQNTTAVFRQGGWQTITQDYVSLDEPLRLGAYETTVRHLLALAGRNSPPSGAGQASPPAGGDLAWDPDRGTFIRPRR